MRNGNSEIAKMNKNHAYPDTELYDHLKSREAALQVEIEKGAASRQSLM